ncbi:hypothetical protein [Streptomyces sp. NBC_00280]|uniref:hypothetical protein n=1 Tax=Streptomyces sp. NBC_00280 TaxID=2975699 RepID=UPI003247130B
MAATLSLLGDVDGAADFARKALGTAAVGSLGGNSGSKIGRVLRGLIHASRIEEAAEIASLVDESHGGLWGATHAVLIEALYEAGHSSYADALVERDLVTAAAMRNPLESRLCSARLRAAQAKGGNGDGAAMYQLWQSTETVEYNDRELEVEFLVELGEGLVTVGRCDDAARVARQALALNERLSNPFDSYTVHKLTVAMIEAGDLPGARRLAEENPNSAYGDTSLRAVQLAEAAAGNLGPLDVYARWPPMDRARLAASLADTEGAARSASDLAHGVVAQVISEGRDADGILWAATLLAVEVLRYTDGVADCEALLSRIRPVGRRAEALAKLSHCCRATDDTTADRLLTKAVDQASRLRKEDTRVSALCAVLRAAGPLRDSTPGIPRVAAAIGRYVEKPGPKRAGVGASAAMALWDSGLSEHARQFALKAYGLTRREDNDEDWHLVCYALTRIGMYGSALRMAEGVGFSLILADIAKSCAEAGDLRTAGQAAERGLQTWQAEGSYDDPGEAEALIDAMLHAQRPDLAVTLFKEYQDQSFEPERVVQALTHGLVMQGHASEALSLARSLRLQSCRAQALVSWGSAPAWPLDMHRRNLRLLQEHALRRDSHPSETGLNGCEADPHTSASESSRIRCPKSR